MEEGEKGNYGEGEGRGRDKRENKSGVILGVITYAIDDSDVVVAGKLSTLCPVAVLIKTFN